MPQMRANGSVVFSAEEIMAAATEMSEVVYAETPYFCAACNRPHVGGRRWLHYQRDSTGQMAFERVTCYDREKNEGGVV